MDRRGFLLTTGAVLAWPTLAHAQTPAMLRARRNVSDMSEDDPDLVALRTGCARLGSLTDRMNAWRDLANIHDCPAPDAALTGSPARASWHTCRHNSEHFLPWHRAYLLMFEALIQQASGKADFTLPYWDAIANPIMPAPFRAQRYKGQPNALWHKRNDSVNEGQPLASPVKTSAFIVSNASAFRGWYQQGADGCGGFGGAGDQGPGELETFPHNKIHTLIGGDMGGTEKAARDPIFWLHHCNVDRLWQVWRNADAAHHDPDDNWLDQTWTFNSPAPATGPAKFEWKTADLLDSHAMPAPLAYAYDNDRDALAIAHGAAPPAPRLTPPRPRNSVSVALNAQAETPPPPAPPPPERAGSGAPQAMPPMVGSSPGMPHAQHFPGEPPVLSGRILALIGATQLGRHGIGIHVQTPVEDANDIAGRGRGTAHAAQPHLALVLEGVRAAKSPGVYYEIYVNLPETPTADLAAYYVGSIDPWTLNMRMDGMSDESAGATLTFPLTHALRATLSISIIPVGAPNTGNPVTFTSAHIVEQA